MSEPRGHLDLAQETLGTDLRRNIGTQDFDGDRALVAQVPREKYHRHSTLAEGSLYFVAADEAGCESLLEFIHGLQNWVDRHLSARVAGGEGGALEKP